MLKKFLIFIFCCSIAAGLSPRTGLIENSDVTSSIEEIADDLELKDVELSEEDLGDLVDITTTWKEKIAILRKVVKNKSLDKLEKLIESYNNHKKTYLIAGGASVAALSVLIAAIVYLRKGKASVDSGNNENDDKDASEKEETLEEEVTKEPSSE